MDFDHELLHDHYPTTFLRLCQVAKNPRATHSSFRGVRGKTGCFFVRSDVSVLEITFTDGEFSMPSDKRVVLLKRELSTNESKL